MPATQKSRTEHARYAGTQTAQAAETRTPAHSLQACHVCRIWHCVCQPCHPKEREISHAHYQRTRRVAMSGWDSAAFDRWLTTDPENQPEIPEDDSEESYLEWLAFMTGKATEE